MPLSTLAPILSTLFIALGLVLPGILKRDGFSAQVNGYIAFLVVFLASLATALVQSKLGPDFAQDLLIVMTGIHALLGIDGPFRQLDQYLQANINAGAKQSPLEKFAWANAAPYIQDEETLKTTTVHPQELPAVKPNNQQAGG